MKIAVIDDSDPKMERICPLIQEKYKDCQIKTAKSFHTAMELISSYRPDLIILDMTLPSTETEDGRLAGRMRMFGGRDLLAELEFLDIATDVIVLSQFEDFMVGDDQTDLESLLSSLKSNFEDFYKGGIYYDPSSKWESELLKLIEDIQK